ncbi:hypothetical protein F4804DRAFT_58564 [Jackrogersella minutella]|nr:hypothetical protein F4804DRAFT_58564 [Jackrogersella minutella]
MELTLFAVVAVGISYLPVGYCASSSTSTTDGISSCGDAWIPGDDVMIAQGTDQRPGFSTAVKTFCSAANGQTVKPDGYLSMATEVFLSGGKDPTTYGILGFVYFEVHNKESSDHTISTENCTTYLSALSADGGECSGATNHDTKGGTWQVGDNGVSYHALGNEIPPQQDAIDKLFSGAALAAQSVNKGSGPPLNPWPLDSVNIVKPTNCHSHNDYTRNIPIYSAMSAGCIGIEADVFYVDGDVIIGHTIPTPGRTLSVQYTEPLRAILDHNNGGSPGSNGLYKAEPSRGITLLVDFKTSTNETLDAVVKALQPLRDGGYLSHLEDGKFVQKQITVVASGSAPFDRINAGDGVPDRDLFYDAKVDQWNSEYTSANSYYASADFESDIGSPGSATDFTQDQKNKVETQVSDAHGAGLIVRYYDLPGDYMWEPLAALGVDMLNADDMYDTARLSRV